MGIHIYVEAIIFGNSQHFDRMAYPFFVVDAWALGFNSFPREDVPDSIVAVSLQPCEVDMCVVLGERPLVECDIVAIEKVIDDLRGLIERLAWILCISSNIDAAENDLAPGGVDKFAVFNSKAERGHVGLWS